MLNKNTLLKIKKFALKIDHDISFGGKSKGNRHLLRIVRVAKFLAKKTGADSLVVEAGAFLHDIALPSGNDYDYLRNKKIVRNVLKPFNLSRVELNSVAECVASHEGLVTPRTLEAKVVHDADVLEKSGILGIIRHTWKLTNFGKITPNNIRDEDVEEVFSHLHWRSRKIQTSIGRKINKYLDIYLTKKQAKEIIQEASEAAARGIITERIVASLLKGKTLSPSQKTMLKSQLDLSYLGKV